MTYYTEIRESSGRKRKVKFFGRATLLKNGAGRIVKLMDEKDAEETVKNKRLEKYRNSIIFL